MLNFFIYLSAILFTLLWVNLLLVDFINIKLYPFSTNQDEEKKLQEKRAKLKIYLIIIMSISWALVFTM